MTCIGEPLCYSAELHLDEGEDELEAINRVSDIHDELGYGAARSMASRATSLSDIERRSAEYLRPVWAVPSQA